MTIIDHATAAGCCLVAWYLLVAWLLDDAGWLFP